LQRAAELIAEERANRDAWQAAHEQLARDSGREILRLKRENAELRFRLEHREALLRHVEPLLPDWLRDDAEHVETNVCLAE
jgi:hypothetical protein